MILFSQKFLAHIIPSQWKKKTHRMNDGRKFPLRSSTVIPMEPEAQAQLRQNMSCSVSKPSRFQGTLNLRDI